METRTSVLRGTMRCGFALAVLFGLLCRVGARAADEQQRGGSALSDVLTVEQRNWLRAPGRVVRIGVTSIPPQIFRDPATGKLSGLCIDFIRELEQVLGYRFEVVHFTTWNEMMGAAFMRDIDVVYAAQRTPSREAAFLFSEPYLRFDNKIVTTEDVHGPLTLADLSGKRVAVVSGAAIEEHLREHYPTIRLMSVDDELIGLTRVSFNQADAMVIEIARASWFIQQNKFTNLHIVGDARYVYELGFASRNDQPELTAILNAGLAQIDSARRQALVNRWILPVERRGPDLRILLIVVSSLMALLLAAFGWNRLLSLRVRQRTRELEQELRAHREDLSALRRYETIISLSDDQMAFVNSEGVYLAANEAFLKAINRPFEDVIGRTVMSIAGEAFFEAHIREPFEAALSGKASNFELWTDSAVDGGRHYLQGVYLPYCAESGVIEGAVVVIHDITAIQIARQELSDREGQLRSLILASPVGIGLVKDRILLSVNQKVCTITGYSEAELVGQSSRMLYPTQDDFDYVGAEKYRQIALFGVGTVETRWRRKDGVLIDVLLSSAPLDVLHPEKGTTFTALDITDRTAAEHALQESERRLKLLLANLPGMAYRCYNDPAWTMAFVSEGCLELTGYFPEELVNNTVLSYNELVSVDDQAALWTQWQEVLARKGRFAQEYRIRTKSGQTKWVWEQGAGVYSADGEVLALEGFITDITDRKQAEAALRASESRYRELVDLAVDGILLGSSEGIVVEANSYMLTLVGKPREAVVGRHIRMLFDTETLDRVPLRFDLLRQGQVVVNERILRRSDGSVLTIEMRTKMMPDGTYQSIVRDVTDRKQAEEARERLLKEVRSKNEELESIVFIASHDLRSPLVNIRGFAGELEKSFEEVRAILRTAEGVSERLAIPLESDIPESLGFIKGSSQKMETLLNGLLRLSRIGTAQIHPVTIAMDQMIGGIIGGLGFKIRENAIDIAVEGALPSCRGDLTLINQVFVNLLDNAIKYRHPERQCRIRIRGRADGGRSVYEVEDNGIGIAAEHKGKIFDIFHQLSPGSGGEGLGLTIVRRVLDRQGGQIELESGVGVGTTVRVTLPSAGVLY